MPDAPLESDVVRRSPSKTVWVLAYFFGATSLPFLCLRRAGAIGNLECILGFMAGLLVHMGPIPVLAATDGDPAQAFVILSMGMGMYLVVMWQYLAGRRASLWSPAALKQWRLASIFFAAFLAFAFAAAVTQARIVIKLHPEHRLEKLPHRLQP